MYHRFKAWYNKQITKIDSTIETKWEDYAGGAYDSTPDEREIKYSEIAGNTDEFEIPRKFTIDNGTVNNQYATNHCVAFGSTEGRNEASTYYKLKIPYLDPKTTTAYIKEHLDPNISEKGTWIYN